MNRDPHLSTLRDETPLHRRVGFSAFQIPTFACSVVFGLFGAGVPEVSAEDNGPVVSVSATDEVELHVEDLSLSEVLRMLSMDGRRNIIASPKVKGTVTANLYGVPFDEALQAVLASVGAGYRVSGKFFYVYTNEELAEMAGKNQSSSTRVFRLNYVSAADANTYLAPLLGEAGTISVSPAPPTGLSSDRGATGGNANASQDFIIVTAPFAIMAEIERILREIDVRPAQVLIEATILRAELNDENALGIDFTVVGGVDLEGLGAASTGVTDLTLGQLPQERFELFNSNVNTGFTQNVPEGGLQIGIIKDNVALFLRALEQITDTTVLANPKILTLNKQQGYVIVGRRDGYLTTTVTETQAIQSVEFLETGTQLVFRPFVGNDGFIRVELHPEDSVGFVNAQGLPSKQTTEVTTNVILRDGETILIGGLFREVTTETKKQVPGLGAIPGVGTLFRSKSDSAKREEVIILLTIHQVKDHAAYAQASRDQGNNAETLRIGTRNGLMWHGRQRVAERHIRKAAEARAEGDTRRALWHVNFALYNDSRSLNALELKNSLLEQQDWQDLGAAGGRTFLHQIISQERAAAAESK
jgi:type IV pilus assembly protein PilQ